MTPKLISTIIPGEMSKVDDMIVHYLYSPIKIIQEVGAHIIKSGGKRLRPAIVVLSALASNYNSGTNHLKLATVVEFIHTATLLHDDVVDESRLRRGSATANVIFGNAATVLVGDFLYSRAFQLVAEIENDQVTYELAQATNTIAEGEISQLINLQDPEISEDTYYAIVRSKTARLFETAAKLGAILGGLENHACEAFASYGSHMGVAFQLIDDALDYSGDKDTIGKNLGDDFSQGKVTLPLIYVMKNGSDKQRKFLRDAIKSQSDSNLERVVEVMELNNAIEYVHGKAKIEIQLAIDALQAISDSKYKKCLIDLAKFSIERRA